MGSRFLFRNQGGEGMIASLVHLDRNSIMTNKIKDSYGLHKFIYSLFPGDNRDFLYYDKGGDIRGRKILIISRALPEIPENVFVEIKRIPTDFFNYSTYSFQTKLNPISKESKSNQYKPIKGHGNLSRWFIDHQEIWGFEVDEESLEIVDWGVDYVITKQGEIPFNTATFRGVLRVRDKGLFQKTFEQGIGRGKAFGFGLLQITSIRN